MRKKQREYKVHWLSAIAKLERLKENETDIARLEEYETAIQLIHKAIAEVDALLDEAEGEQRKNGGIYGFLPGGKVYVDEDELEYDWDEFDENEDKL